MRSSRLLGGLFLLASPLAAQAGPASSNFVARLGRDTVALERVTRTAGRIEGDLFTTSPRARRVHYVATLDARGQVSQFEVTSTPAVEPPPAPVITIRAEIADTLGTLVLTRGAGKPDTVRYKVGAGAVPFLSLSIGMLEQMTVQARRSGKDSVAIDVLVAGLKQATPNYVAKRGRDSVAVDYFGLPMYLRVDGSGRVLGLNGARSTEKFLIDRVAALDLDRLAGTFIARERAGQVAGALSTRDTARVTVGAVSVWVDYGRPMKRGRVLLGGIVPWNEVWRTGANAATQLSTSADLKVGDTVIPAGIYTLWTVPTPEGTTLIVNSRVGQWGTEYEASKDKDFARFALRTESLAEPVERFTISLLPVGNGGEIRFDWDRTRWVLPFTVK
jgi:hypothetical protein